MVRWIIVWSVFRKEVLNTLRDKKTLFINLGLPVLLYPVLALSLSQIVAVQVGKQAEQISQIVLLGDEAPGLRDALHAEEKLELLSPRIVNGPDWDVSLLADDLQQRDKDIESNLSTERQTEIENQRKTAEAVIQDKRVETFIIVERQPATDTTQPDNYRIWLSYDSTKGASTTAAQRVREVLDTWQDSQLTQRLESIDLSKRYIEPLELERYDLAQHEKRVSFLLGSILPYILIAMLLVGCFLPAVEMTAGEKELGTLPTLLCTPVHHLELVLGKYFTVVLIAMTSVLANLSSIAAVMAFGLGSNFQLDFSFGLIMTIFMVLVPFALLYAAISLAVAVFANTFKEGQHMLTPVMLAGLLPAISGIIPDIELTPGMAMLPGFNVTLLLKQIMIESIHPELIFITLVSNTLFAVLALIFAARVFSHELVIFGGGNLFDTIFKMRRNSFPRPDMGLGLLVFTILLVASFYVSSSLAGFGLHVQIPAMQIGVFLCIPLLIGYYFRWSLKEVFRLNIPSFTAVIGAIIIGSSAWLAVSWTAQIIPIPPEFAAELMKTLGLDTLQYHIVVQIVILALLPAICEEFAFRGMLMSAFLKHFSPPIAILCTAICFGLAHMSLYRFIPTLVLGLILGYAVWKTRSIWVGVIIHAFNNGVLVLTARYEDWLNESLVNVGETASIGIIAAATLVCGVGFWCLSLNQSRDSINADNFNKASTKPIQPA